MYFPQEHPPGREAQFDFTHCGELKVTIAGQSYPHLLFQLILSHSGWRYAEVAAGKTFLALPGLCTKVRYVAESAHFVLWLAY